jgi:hypothetical protein
MTRMPSSSSAAAYSVGTSEAPVAPRRVIAPFLATVRATCQPSWFGSTPPELTGKSFDPPRAVWTHVYWPDQ